MIWRPLVLALRALPLVLLVTLSTGLVLLFAGGNKLLSVQSGSMAPAIRAGDLVSVKSVPASKLAVGDVITFMSQDKQSTITHRIVALLAEDPAGNSIVTKGDANKQEDSPIEAASVIGKVEHRVPHAGKVLDFLRSWPGLLLVIYVPMLLIVVHEIRLLTTYFKSREPYVVPWRRPKKSRLSFVTGLVITLLSISSITVVPVIAALTTTASLSGNTITSVVPPTPPISGVDTDVVLQRLKFTCAESNTEELNKTPGIRIYNHGTGNVDISGWYFTSLNGVIATVPANTVLAPNTSLNFDPVYAAGLNYDGDFLRLFNDTGEQIDGISWGNNTSEFNPSLPAKEGDWRYHRRPPISQSESTAADWDIINGGGCRQGEH